MTSLALEDREVTDRSVAFRPAGGAVPVFRAGTSARVSTGVKADGESAVLNRMTILGVTIVRLVRKTFVAKEQGDTLWRECFLNCDTFAEQQIAVLWS